MKNLSLLVLFCLLLAPLGADSFTTSLEEHVHFDKVSPRLGIIKLDDRSEAISESTWIHINAALNHYKETKPAAIILELNSPGGEVFAAERISDALKEMDTQYSIPVICYIDNWAISAGAMLAYSCRYIVVAKDASMGAAEPITMGEGGKMETASEKVNSALRSDFANHAKFFDRNPYIAEAMVDKDIILVEREGKIIKLDSEDQIRKESDFLISPKGKLLTLNAGQLIEYGVASQVFVPKSLPALTAKEQEEGRYPLTKTDLQQIPYFQTVPNIVIEEFHLNWQTKFLAFLATPAVSSLLFMVLLVALYVEISGGGFGLAGAVALIALFLVLLSSFAMEAIHVLEPVLLAFGLILVGLEVFFFPTLGILGIIGVVFMIMGLAGMMIPGIESVSYDGNVLNVAGEYVLNRLAWLSGAFLVALVVIVLLSRYMLPKFALANALVLSEDMRSKAAVVGNLPESPLTDLPKAGVDALVTAALRPAGKVTVDNMEYDAVSTGGFILEGSWVRIVRIEGAKVVVEERYS